MTNSREPQSEKLATGGGRRPAEKTTFPGHMVYEDPAPFLFAHTDPRQGNSPPPPAPPPQRSSRILYSPPAQAPPRLAVICCSQQEPSRQYSARHRRGRESILLPLKMQQGQGRWLEKARSRAPSSREAFPERCEGVLMRPRVQRLPSSDEIHNLEAVA